MVALVGPKHKDVIFEMMTSSSKSFKVATTSVQKFSFVAHSSKDYGKGAKFAPTPKSVFKTPRPK